MNLVKFHWIILLTLVLQVKLSICQDRMHPADSIAQLVDENTNVLTQYPKPNTIFNFGDLKFTNITKRSIDSIIKYDCRVLNKKNNNTTEVEIYSKNLKIILLIIYYTWDRTSFRKIYFDKGKIVSTLSNPNCALEPVNYKENFEKEQLQSYNRLILTVEKTKFR